MRLDSGGEAVEDHLPDYVQVGSHDYIVAYAA